MRVYATVFFYILSVLGCCAQQPTRLPTVVVQGLALSEPDPLDSADRTRIPAQNLEQQQSVTLSDALRSVPGAYVTQSGGIGQEAKISLRGTGSANTTVIVNGMPIHDTGDLDQTLNLSRWTVDDVAEIEVIRGPMSSLYGPSGMGGVVLIKTKRGQGPHKTFARAEGGSFQTFSQSVGIQGQRDLIDYHVMGSRLQSAGTTTTPDRFLSQIQEKANNPLHQENLTARIGAGSESAHISLFSRYLTRRVGFRQTPVSSYPFRQNYADRFNRLQGHFEAASGRWSHDIGLGYYQNDLINTHPTESKVTRKGSQAQVDWRQSIAVTRQLQFQVAMDYSRETLYWYKVPALNNHFQASHGGIGGTLSYRVSENLMVTGSSRVDKYQGITPTSTYRMGAEYTVEKIVMKGGIGTAFKAPTLQQKFYKDPFFTGNPNLKPERSLGIDWGIERSFFQNYMTLGVTLFQNRIRDMITGTVSGNTLMNMNKVRTQGVEGIVRIEPLSAWSIEFTHTYTKVWDERTGQGVIGNPRNKSTLSVIGQLTSAWQLSGDILYVSSRDTFDGVTFKRVKTPSYTIVGAEVSYRLNDQWQVYGRGENLLNRLYESPSSLQQPGLGVYVGIRAQC